MDAGWGWVQDGDDCAWRCIFPSPLGCWSMGALQFSPAAGGGGQASLWCWCCIFGRIAGGGFSQSVFMNS